MENTKTCTICKTPKQESEFHAYYKPGKTRPDCKECRRKKNREYYDANKIEIRAKFKKEPRPRRTFSDCKTSFTDTAHIWYKCSTCQNQYQRENRASKNPNIKKHTQKEKKISVKFCQCEVPVLLMKNSENGIHAYCKTCAKPTKI